MQRKFNILMSQKMILTISQKMNFLFEKEPMQYVANSEFSILGASYVSTNPEFHNVLMTNMKETFKCVWLKIFSVLHLAFFDVKNGFSGSSL